MSPTDTQIPEKLLKAFDLITLGDLLRLPVFRSFLISGLSNAVRGARDINTSPSEEELFTEYKINQLIASIPYEVRRNLYEESNQVNQMGSARRRAIQEKRSRATRRAPSAQSRFTSSGNQP